jgi:hypothetical protein
LVSHTADEITIIAHCHPVSPSSPAPVTTGLPSAGAGYEYHSFSLDGSNGLTGKGFLPTNVTSP